MGAVESSAFHDNKAAWRIMAQTGVANPGMAQPGTPQDDQRDDDTPLTDALLDQFAGYYVLAVLAVRALEEARRQKRLASDSA